MNTVLILLLIEILKLFFYILFFKDIGYIQTHQIYTVCNSCLKSLDDIRASPTVMEKRTTSPKTVEHNRAGRRAQHKHHIHFLHWGVYLKCFKKTTNQWLYLKKKNQMNRDSPIREVTVIIEMGIITKLPTPMMHCKWLKTTYLNYHLIHLFYLYSQWFIFFFFFLHACSQWFKVNILFSIYLCMQPIIYCQYFI